MNIYEVIGLVSAVVTILGFMWSIKKDLASKFDKLDVDITKLDSDLRTQSKRTDQQLASQSARTDQLYTMFIIGLEENRKRTDKLYEMFVDLVSKLK